MKRYLYFILFAFCGYFHVIYAQVIYYDASCFPLYGKCEARGMERYNRFPDTLQQISRKPLWELSTNSAGLAVRFRSNSSAIYARWVLKYNNHMNHMADTGVKGLDLYCWKNGEWVYVNVGRPFGKFNEGKIIGNMTPDWREYMLYLPLYDGIDSLAIGIDNGAQIAQPAMEVPRRNKPVVLYGTSILQGACASRPGMAYTNILGRMLGVETINLGFSGNAFLDLEVADLMALVDASVFVIDCVPNASVEMMEKNLYEFYRRLRTVHPRTPVVFIEDPVFTHAAFDNQMDEEIKRKNATLYKLYQKMKKDGEPFIAFIGLKDFFSSHNDATVDGIHFTDVGMEAYAKLLYKHLRKYM